MIFLLRSIFWLGLVFTIAPSNVLPDRSGAGRAIADVTAETVGAVAASVPAIAQEVCRQSPANCLRAAAKLRSSSSMRTKSGRRRSADTLTDADRAPRWRSAANTL